MNDKTIKILLAGEGGQGVQAIGKILSDAGYQQGLNVSFIPNYGVEQRGGVTIAFIQYRKDQTIVYPKFSQADILVWLSKRSIKRTQQYVGKNTLVVYNLGSIKKLKNQSYIGINFNDLANEINSYRSVNLIVLGFILQHLTDWLEIKKIKQVINKKFEKYYKLNPKLKELNDKGVDIGLNYKL